MVHPILKRKRQSKTACKGREPIKRYLDGGVLLVHQMEHAGEQPLGTGGAARTLPPQQ